MPNKTNSKPKAAPELPSCPVEALMREHAKIYRAKALADAQSQETPEGEPNELIADWSPQHLWQVMCERVRAIEELARTEQATSKVGAAYQLMLARGVMPVSSMSLDAKGNDDLFVATKQALMDEQRVESYIESAFEVLVMDVQDADLDVLMPIYGPSEPFNASGAIRNLLNAVSEKPTKLKIVS